MSAKLTDWYPAHVKPVRVGYYSASLFRDDSVVFWSDSKQWCTGEDHPTPMRPVKEQDREWRGLARKPK